MIKHVWFWWFGEGQSTTTGSFPTRAKCVRSMRGYAGQPVRVRGCFCRSTCQCGYARRCDEAIFALDPGCQDCRDHTGIIVSLRGNADLIAVAGRVLHEYRDGRYCVLPAGPDPNHKTEAVNIRTHKCDVYVGRGCWCGEKPAGNVPLVQQTRVGDFGAAYLREHPLANAWRVGRDGDRDEVLEKYRLWISSKIDSDPVFREMVRSLYGKRLGCWCCPKACHAQVIADAADRLFKSDPGVASPCAARSKSGTRRASPARSKPMRPAPRRDRSR